MRNIAAEEYQVARLKTFDAVAYKANAGALLYQHQLALGVKMPGWKEMRLVHFHDLEGPVLLGFYNFK